MISRKHAEAAFLAYTSSYDAGNSMIRHKVDHTLRVAENCERIAHSLSMDEEQASWAWFLGLLHDIGRFEQVRRFGTFIDAVSVDHAELSADLLFREGLIRHFADGELPEAWAALLETAVRQHNKLTLPAALDERTRLFCDLIRDADKVDIFRVVAELPFEERIGTSKGLILEGDEAGDGVMDCVRRHCCVPRAIRKTRFEGLISHGCMAFELVFPESRKMCREQGWLSRLLADTDEDGKPLWSARQSAQLRILRGEIENAWDNQPAES